MDERNIDVLSDAEQIVSLDSHSSPRKNLEDNDHCSHLFVPLLLRSCVLPYFTTLLSVSYSQSASFEALISVRSDRSHRL